MQSLVRLIIVACAMFSLNTRALAIDPVAVVKIHSFPCLPMVGPKLQGSGILVRQSAASDQFYVITSEHAVLHGNGEKDGICHEISLSEVLFGGDYEGGLRDVSAKLHVADWNSGLALLRLSANTGLRSTNLIPVIDAPIAEANAVNKRLIVQGYRYGENILTEGKGRFGRTLERKAINPSGLPIFVIDDSFGDFGMSGGAISTAAGELVGVLSHKLDPIEQGPIRRSSGQLLAIRWIDVQNWFKKVFHSNFQLIYSRNPWDQIAGRHAIYAFGLRFEAVRAHPNRCESPMQPQLSKADYDSTNLIGVSAGHDPIGIGGHDPIGIGGQIEAKPSGSYIDILVSPDLNYDGSATNHSFFLSTRVAKLIHSSLKLKSTVFLSELDHTQEYCIRSLEAFFDKARYSGSN